LIQRNVSNILNTFRMQYNNILVLACAGSGKTYGICNDAKKYYSESNTRVLMVSYTHRGVDSIRNEYAKQNHGVLDKHVVIRTWYQFLLRELIKPYQSSFLGEISKVNSFDFSQMFGVDYKKKNTIPYFFNKNYDVKANRASELAVLINKLSGGAVIKRLEETYSCIYLDELQDLVGKDVELLELLLQSSIRVYCVGDYKQATFRTHNPKTDRKKGGKNIFQDFELFRERYQIHVIKDNKSKRFVSDIADFANLVYPEDPITGLYDVDEKATGVYQILKSDVHAYINHFRPNILRYDVNTSTLGYPSMNFGVSKGMTFDRVLIFPNNSLCTFLRNPKKRISSPEKYYVAVTRPRYSLAFVVDEFIPNEYFLEDTIELQEKRIPVLKFRYNQSLLLIGQKT